MKEITPKVLEHGAAALTAVVGTTTTIGSYFQFLNDNAPGLGVLLTFLFEYDTGVIVNGHTFYTHCKIDGLIYLVELDEYTETPQQGERVITH